MNLFKKWLEAKAKLGDISNHPLYGATPPTEQPPPPENVSTATPRKLNTDVPVQQVIEQYLRAFLTRLEQGASDEEAQKIIETNSKKIAHRYGVQAGEFFVKKANYQLQNFRSYQNAIK